MRLRMLSLMAAVGAPWCAGAAAQEATNAPPVAAADAGSTAERRFGRPGAVAFTLDQVEESLRPASPGADPREGHSAARRILDVRPRADYDAGHIPTAVWVDVKAAQAIAARPGGLADAAAWAEWTRPLGLEPGMAVLIVDGERQLEAARTWWLLRYLGVPEASLVDGNFGLWQAQERPVTRDVPAVPQEPFPVALRRDRLAMRDDVLATIKAKDARIVDARSAEEWIGKALRAKRGGHMPEACRLEWLDFVDQRGRFLDADAIRSRIRDAGIGPGESVVTHCQGGGRASVDAFVFEALGHPTRNFYLGWSDWGNADDTPISTAVAQEPRPAADPPAERPAPRPAGDLVPTTPEAPPQAPAPAQPSRPAPAAAPADARPASSPFRAEYYYKCQWGRADEFLALFRQNHLPILRERAKQGDILRVTMTRPRIHENEAGRWDYRVTIEFRDAAAAFDPSGEQAIKERLFPDQDRYRLDEQRRFALLDAHWDLPIEEVDLDQPIKAP